MADKQDELLYRIAITLIPGIGHINARKLISWAGGAEKIFRQPRNELLMIPGMAKLLGPVVNTGDLLRRAELELKFITNNNIRALYYYDEDYPERLKHCPDSPLMLYLKGNEDFKAERYLGVVGTRNATAYGQRMCQEIIEGFSDEDIVIVSGMAYGIDSCAHRRSLSAGLRTLGVLAHGLDRIYPGEHRSLASRMLSQGGLATEFLSNTIPDRENFPKRNRIIAGLCDAVLVVESAGKGGAIITAEIANSYNRDVFAVPGRANDEYSDGCHLIIRRNIAALTRSAEDIKYSMGWDKKVQKKKERLEILERFTDEEKKVLGVILGKEKAHIDDIVLMSGLGASATASILLKLEFSGVIAGLPGKIYEIRGRKA